MALQRLRWSGLIHPENNHEMRIVFDTVEASVYRSSKTRSDTTLPQPWTIGVFISFRTIPIGVMLNIDISFVSRRLQRQSNGMRLSRGTRMKDPLHNLRAP